MLKICLKREGKVKTPMYKIVLIENLRKRDGKFIKNLGYYNPLKKYCYINKLLLIKYLNLGAYPTHTVRHLIQHLI
jgi:small subunit ribosomal protein S16